MRALLLLTLALPALAIDGTVVNKTTGQPAANAAVTLIQMGQGGMQPEGSVRTDAQGKFTFRRKTPPATHLLQVTFDGVTYSQMLQPGAPSTGLSVRGLSTRRRSPARRASATISSFSSPPAAR